MDPDETEQMHYVGSLVALFVLDTYDTRLSCTYIAGNFMVMISFKMDKQLQTISNYFLFSLAVADLIIGLISMPLNTVYMIQGVNNNNSV